MSDNLHHHPTICSTCAALTAEIAGLRVRLGDKLIAEATSEEGTVGGHAAVIVQLRAEIARLTAVNEATLEISTGLGAQLLEANAENAGLERRLIEADVITIALRADVARLKEERDKAFSALVSSGLGPCKVHQEFVQGCMRCVVTRLHVAEAKVERLKEWKESAISLLTRYDTAAERLCPDLRLGDSKVEALEQLDFAPLRAVAKAAQEFHARVEWIEASQAYQGVWSMSQIHAGPYQGESWRNERDRLKDALAHPAVVEGMKE